MRQAAHSGTLNNSRPLGVTRVLSLLTPIKPINIQSPYGGPGGSRTRVQDAFTLKGLQQYCNYTALLFSTATILAKKN